MHKIIRNLANHRFAQLGMRFAGVGAVGFVVDSAGTLFMAREIGFGNDVSRILAMVTGIAVTYGLNRRFTFESRDSHLFKEGGRYALVNFMGAAINLGGFHIALIIAANQGFPAHQLVAQSAAIIVGSACAFLFNYPGSYFFAFTK